MTLNCAAILFDLDGVLVHSAASVRRSWHRWAIEHGLEPGKVATVAQGRRTVETIQLLAPELDAARSATELEAMQALDTIDVVAGLGARELVAVLDDSEWAVVTSGTASLARSRLRAAGIPEPNVMVTGDDVHTGKPNPEGYLLAATRLGIDSSACVVVEDAAIGVRAARMAGMRVIGLANDNDGADLVEANLIVHSCQDIVLIHDVGQTGNGRLVVSGGSIGGMSEHVDVEAPPSVAVDPDPQMVQHAAKVRRHLDVARIWHVNSTATGGGVAELLRSSISRHRLLGLPAGWLVTDGVPGFFELTKRVHHGLHGRGDVHFTRRDRELYEQATSRSADQLRRHVRRGDLVVLHDPQTLGIAGHLMAAGARVAWRCHVGTSSADATTEAWDLLRPYLQHIPRCIFSNVDYAPAYLAPTQISTILPSIDPMAAKNLSISPTMQSNYLASIGLTELPPSGQVIKLPSGNRLGHTVQDMPLLDGVPTIVQVSRWDPLKDMNGVLRTFVEFIAPHSDAHLLLAGPDPADIPDDPEGESVYAEVRHLYESLAQDIRARIHLVMLSLRDFELNALAVNAVQRRATIVVQKSLEEGFGLTVTEAMWKSKPIVASDVGGLIVQIEHGVNGMLVDPTDYAAFGATALQLLHDPEYAEILGQAAHERCKENFLADRELSDYLQLYLSMLA